MKKIIYCIASVMAICFFLLYLDVFDTNLFSFYSENIDQSLYGENYVECLVEVDEYTESSKWYVEQMVAYAKSEKANVILRTSSTELGKTYLNIYYLNTSDLPYLNAKYTVENRDVMFNENDSTQLTTNPEHKGNHYVFLGDEYYQSDTYIESAVLSAEAENGWENNALLRFVVFKENENQKIEKALLDTFNNHDNVAISMQKPFDITYDNIFQNDSVMIRSVLIVTISFFIILMFLYALNTFKETKIRILNGNQFFKIYQRIYHSLILKTILIVIAVFFITYLVVIKRFCPLGFEFLSTLYIGTLVFYIVLNLLSLFFYIFIRTYLLFKQQQKSSMAFIYGFTGLFRTCILVLSGIQLITCIQFLNYNLKPVQIIHQFEDVFKDKAYITNLSNYFHTDFETERKKVFELFNEKGALFFDYDPWYYSQNEEIKVMDIAINDDFVDLFGNEELKKITAMYSDENIVCFPKAYQSHMSYDTSYFAKDSSIYVLLEEDVNIPILDYTLTDITKLWIQNPVIHIVRNPHQSLRTIRIQYPNFIIDVAENEEANAYVVSSVNDTIFKDKISVVSSNDVVDSIVNGYIHTSLKTIFQMILYCALLMLFTIVHIRLYFIQLGKELAIRYIHGNSFFKKYGFLFISNFMFIMIAYLCMILYYQQNWLYSFIYLFVVYAMDLFITLYVVHSFEKRQIINTLKGGNNS